MTKIQAITICEEKFENPETGKCECGVETIIQYYEMLLKEKKPIVVKQQQQLTKADYWDGDDSVTM